MDTSETYIFHCQKATEIQALRPPRQDFQPADFYATREKIRSGEHKGEVRWMAWVAENGDCGMDQRDKDDTWLPRQDQLQEIVSQGSLVFEGGGAAASNLCHAFDLWVRQNWIWGNSTTDEVFASMEQLRLAFVMWERYQKRWTGGDWK